MARCLQACRERLWGSCAQILCPPVVICFLGGSYLGQFILGKLEPIFAFLGEQVHLIEFVCLLAWGAWIVRLGLPYLGYSFALIAMVPSWPYAMYDALNQESWRRIGMATIGLRHLQEYHGAASSPEMELLATVLGKVPMMAVIAMASAEGTDVLLSGFKENGLLRFVTMAYVFLSGMSIASVSYACVDAVSAKDSREGLGFEEALAAQIDGWISRLNTYLIHAVDTLTVVTVMGGVGGHYNHEDFLAWLLCLWLFTGLLPAILAPPPMPTLRPALPKRGLRAFCHKAAVSILLLASPPTEFMPLLPVRKQRVWAASTLVRAVWILASSLALPALRKPLFAGLELIHIVVPGAVAIATVALIRLLHHEVRRTRQLFRERKDSFYSAEAFEASLKEPLCKNKVSEEVVSKAETDPGDPENPQEPAAQSEAEASEAAPENAQGSKLSEETEEVPVTFVTSDVSGERRTEPVVGSSSAQEIHVATLAVEPEPVESSEHESEFLPQRLEDQQTRRNDNCRFLCCQASEGGGWLLSCSRPEVAEDIQPTFGGLQDA